MLLLQARAYEDIQSELDSKSVRSEADGEKGAVCPTCGNIVVLRT